MSAPDRRPPFYLGIDLGGTNIKSGVVDDRGQALSSISLETEAEHGPQEGLDHLAEAGRRRELGAGRGLLPRLIEVEAGVGERWAFWVGPEGLVGHGPFGPRRDLVDPTLGKIGISHVVRWVFRGAGGAPERPAPGAGRG